MAKVSTERMTINKGLQDELMFKYDVNVNVEGEFSTTLPAEIVILLETAKIELRKNRSGNKGYLIDKTLTGLKKQVVDVMAEYQSKELVSETIILKYDITTTCHYCLDAAGNVVPNGTYVENYKWKDGTTGSPVSAYGGLSYGFDVAVKPLVKKVWLYRSGTVKTEFVLLTYGGQFANDALQDDEVLRWLNDVVKMPWSDRDKELEYTPVVGAFFVQMIKTICNLNEKIKDFIDPESIKMIAESGMKFIG